MTGTTAPIESKRIKALRLGLIKQISKFPNDGASLRSLEGKSLWALLVDFANWAIRYVAPRPRKAIVEAEASTDPRWKVLQNDIDAFLEKVKRGDDLTPHLSLDPHTLGYTPAASAQGPNVDRWADKDMVLNVMGYHHFHPSMTIEPKGFASRTNEIVFAHVTREELTVVAIFDHSVINNQPGQALTPNGSDYGGFTMNGLDVMRRLAPFFYFASHAIRASDGLSKARAGLCTPHSRGTWAGWLVPSAR